MVDELAFGDVHVDVDEVVTPERTLPLAGVHARVARTGLLGRLAPHLAKKRGRPMHLTIAGRTGSVRCGVQEPDEATATAFARSLTALGKAAADAEKVATLEVKAELRADREEGKIAKSRAMTRSWFTQQP